MNATTTNLEVAETIARQIGARAFFMIGTQFKTGDQNSLSFNVRGSKLATHGKVTLEANDTYTVYFCKVRGSKITNGVTVCGVYAENLNATIEIHTGLALSL